MLQCSGLWMLLLANMSLGKKNTQQDIEIGEEKYITLMHL